MAEVTRGADPAAARLAAALDGLGAQQATYGLAPDRLWRRLAPGAGFAAAGLLGGALAAALLLNPDAEGMQFWEKVLLGGAALAVCLIGLAWLAAAYRRRGGRVLECAHGLARVDGARAEAVRWDAVAELRLDADAAEGKGKGEEEEEMPDRLYPLLRVRRRDGTEVVWDDFLGWNRRLFAVLQRETLPLLLPAAVRAFDAGEAVAFGRLRAGRKGLTHAPGEGRPAQALAWGELHAAACDADGVVRVHKNGQADPWFCGAVPNAHVFLALAAHAHRGGRRLGT
jgi:hypothetical protein